MNTKSKSKTVVKQQPQKVGVGGYLLLFLIVYGIALYYYMDNKLAKIMVLGLFGAIIIPAIPNLLVLIIQSMVKKINCAPHKDYKIFVPKYPKIKRNKKRKSSKIIKVNRTQSKSCTPETYFQLQKLIKLCSQSNLFNYSNTSLFIRKIDSLIPNIGNRTYHNALEEIQYKIKCPSLKDEDICILIEWLQTHVIYKLHDSDKAI